MIRKWWTVAGADGEHQHKGKLHKEATLWHKSVWKLSCETPWGRLGFREGFRIFVKGFKCQLVLLGRNSDTSVDPSSSQSYFRICNRVMPFFSSLQLSSCLYTLEAHTDLIVECFGGNIVYVPTVVQYWVLSALIYLCGDFCTTSTVIVQEVCHWGNAEIVCGKSCDPN